MVVVIRIVNIYENLLCTGLRSLGHLPWSSQHPLETDTLFIPILQKWEPGRSCGRAGLGKEQGPRARKGNGGGRVGLRGKKGASKGVGASSLWLSFGQLWLALEFHCLGTNSYKRCGAQICSLSSWTWIPASSTLSTVLLIRPPDLLEPQFPRLWNGNGKSGLSIYCVDQ